MGTRGLDYAALAIVIIGAVNWGLIGFFRFDLVAFLFGNMSWISRIVYALVGLCGLYLLTFFGKLGRSQDCTFLLYRSPFFYQPVFLSGLLYCICSL